MGYNPIEDFQRKDLLESGDDGKIVRGTELQVEFDAISADLAKVRVEQGNLNYLPITGGTVNGDISAQKVTATEFIGGTLSATNVSGTTFTGNGAALTGMKMSQLTDVKMSNVTRDDVLIWNGSAWEASDVYDIVSPLTYAGILDVTQPAPTANNGDVFVNDQEGEAHPSFKGIAGVLILEGKFVIYDAPTDEWNSPGNSAEGGVNYVKAGSGIEVDSIKPSEPVVSIDRSETDAWYEPVFSKNTGFNKNLGTAAGTVSEGNHLHGQYLETETDPTVPAHVKTISTADIAKWNTAPPAAPVSSVNGKTGAVSLTYTDVGAQVAGSYQPAGSYATANHNHSGVYQPVGSYLTTCAAGNGTKLTGTNKIEMSGSYSGTFTATGNITAYSDERLKDNVESLDGSKVYDMRGVSFTKDGEAGSGVIAQELQRVAPELVHDGGDYLSVSYGNVVGYLIEAVKDLKAEVEELKRVR